MCMLTLPIEICRLCMCVRGVRGVALINGHSTSFCLFRTCFAVFLFFTFFLLWIFAQLA